MRRTALVLCAVIAGHVYADCSTPKYGSTPLSAGKIVLTQGTFANGAGPSSALFSAAIDYWNSSCFGEGSAFPMMCAGCTASGSSYPVTVSYSNGAGTSGCGEHRAHEVDGVPDSSTIIIYAYYGGNPCVPLADTLAHELGHVLGLAESNATACRGTIMGGRDPGDTRTVTADACSEISRIWLTPTEVQQRENCSLSCNQACTQTSSGGWTCPDPVQPPGGDSPGDPTCGQGCSPLVFDLDGEGIHTTNVNTDPVLFDLTADGHNDLVGWTDPATEDAFLYYDHNQNRIIDGGSELFGEVTVLQDGTRAQDGFAALAAYDEVAHGGNSDGVISPADGVWGKIRLWVDRNHDGVMITGENFTLGQRQVTQINLAHTSATPDIDFAGNDHRLKGTFVQRIKGETITRAVHDVYFGIQKGPLAGFE